VPRPKLTLFLDPGLGGTGWAIFLPPESTPVASGVIRGKSSSVWDSKVSEICVEVQALIVSRSVKQVVIEFPSLWASATSMASGTKGDLFKLTYLIGGIAEGVRQTCMCKPTLISPQSWKGQLPKDVVIGRIRQILPAYPLRDHEADAIGMGLTTLGYINSR
jgi:hypothetical protein